MSSAPTSSLTQVASPPPSESYEILGASGWRPLDKLSLPWSKYILQRPTPKQLAFLLLETEEAFFGGAGGGGKSSALLMAALQYVDTPGYAALLLRRTFADLAQPGALMSRAQEWLSGTQARWRDENKTWRFPSGATLTFGYLETEADKYRYQGLQLQYIGWDELTQFSESQYRYLFGWLRRLEGADVPLRVRAASNPGGLGHDWVKQRFITEGMAEGRPFIPAKYGDNPHLDQQAYAHSLAQLDPITRRQIMDGDWTARAGGSKFRREWFEVVDIAPADCRWARYWDLAATEPKRGSDPDWTAGCKLGLTKAGTLYIADLRRMRGTPQAVEALIKQTAALDGKAVPIHMEQEPGASGVNTIAYYRRVLMGWPFYGERATGSKEERANPVSSQAEAGNIKLVRGPWIGAFLDEIEAFPGGSHEDQVDALSGAFAVLTKEPERAQIVIFDAMRLLDRTLDL